MSGKKIKSSTEDAGGKPAEGRDEGVPLDYYSFFMARYNEYETYEVKLYRRERRGNGRVLRSFVGRYYDHPPQEEEIAEEHGTGDFTAQSVDPVTGEFYSRDITIDKGLQHLHKPRNQEVHHGPYQGGPPQADPMSYMKDIMGSIVTPLLTILTKSNGNQNNATGNLKMVTDMMDGLMSNFTSGIKKMQSTMIDSTIDNVKKIKAPTNPPPEDTGGEWSWILDIVKAVGAKMFDSEGKLTEKAQTMVKGNPLFSQALEDQEQLDSLYFTMATDPEIGKAKADAMFKGVGVETLSDEDFQKATAGANT